MPTGAFIIAIDGYSSSGKSTLARRIASHFRYTYIDSGAMYRAMTLFFQREKIDYLDEQSIARRLKEIVIRYDYVGDRYCIFLNGENVSEAIRDPLINEQVSHYSTIKIIRDYASEQQRAYKKTEKGIVMDGRDIGTTIFPDAQVKLFLKCDIDARAKRRYAEMSAANPSLRSSLDDVKKNLQERDYIDEHREISPLRQPKDAHVIDNSSLSPDQLFQSALSIIQRTLDSPSKSELP